MNAVTIWLRCAGDVSSNNNQMTVITWLPMVIRNGNMDWPLRVKLVVGGGRESSASNAHEFVGEIERRFE